MRIIQLRTYKLNATYSNAFIVDGHGTNIFNYHILELPWRDNKRSVSCIPEGEYVVVKMKPTEKRPYVYFWIKDVKGRSGILMHRGNYTRQILGCQLPGEKFIDLDKDGMPDIANTTGTLQKMAEILPDKFILEIKPA
jgi:hypothetical protein